MTASKCPCCGETFRIPEHSTLGSGAVPEDTQGQCPWCHERFPFADVLEKLPPMIRLLSAHGEPLSTADSSAPWAAVDNQPDQDLQLDSDPWAALHDDSHQDGGNEMRWKDPSDAPIATPAPMRVSPRAAPRAKKKSGLKTAMGVIIGGALALPIADLLLTLVGQEPLLGIFSFIDRDDSPGSMTAARPMDLSGVDHQQERVDDSRRAANDLTPPSGRALTVPPEDVSPSDLPPPNGQTEDPLARPELTPPEAVDLPPVVEVPTAAEMQESSAADPPAMQREPARPSEPAASAESPALSESPEFAESDESPELTTAVRQARQKLDTAVAFRGEARGRRKALAEAYQEIAKVAETATPSSQSARDLLNTLAASAVIADYENVAPTWLVYPGRRTDGILIVGKPARDGSRTVEFNSGDAIAITGEVTLPDSQRVVALGRIIGEGSDAVVELVMAQEL